MVIASASASAFDRVEDAAGQSGGRDLGGAGDRDRDGAGGVERVADGEERLRRERRPGRTRGLGGVQVVGELS